MTRFELSSGPLSFAVYEAEPASPPKGLVLVIQEIFGVNSHIRDVADRFSREGFLAWAPAYFDPVERGVELGYDADAFPRGRDLVAKLGFENAVEITRATAREMKSRHPGLSLATVGFCWGGSIAWLSATRIGPPDVDRAVSYYGRHAAADFRNERPRIPALLHWGETDPSIPMENVRAMERAHPTVPSHVYAAGHGFNCDQRESYDEAAAKIAWQRTLKFLGN